MDATSFQEAFRHIPEIARHLERWAAQYPQLGAVRGNWLMGIPVEGQVGENSPTGPDQRHPDHITQVRVPLDGLSLWTPDENVPQMQVTTVAIPTAHIPSRSFLRPEHLADNVDSTQLRVFLDDRRTTAMDQLQLCRQMFDDLTSTVREFYEILEELGELKDEFDEDVVPKLDRMMIPGRIPLFRSLFNLRQKYELWEMIKDNVEQQAYLVRRLQKRWAVGHMVRHSGLIEIMDCLELEARNPMNGIATWEDWLDLTTNNVQAMTPMAGDVGAAAGMLWDAIYWWNDFQKNVFLEGTYPLKQLLQAVKADYTVLNDAFEAFVGVMENVSRPRHFSELA